MRKRFCLAALLPMLLLFTACNVNEMSSLPELSRSFAGEYVCERLTVNGEDYTAAYDLLLTLDYGGTFGVRGKGKRQLYSGEYSYDAQRGEITLSAKSGLGEATRSFPVREGRIYVDLTFGGALLHAEFAMP